MLIVSDNKSNSNNNNNNNNNNNDNDYNDCNKIISFFLQAMKIYVLPLKAQCWSKLFINRLIIIFFTIHYFFSRDNGLTHFPFKYNRCIIKYSTTIHYAIISTDVWLPVSRAEDLLLESCLSASVHIILIRDRMEEPCPITPKIIQKCLLD